MLLSGNQIITVPALRVELRIKCKHVAPGMWRHADAPLPPTIGILHTGGDLVSLVLSSGPSHLDSLPQGTCSDL